jgi:dolichyl-phosphate beta-glucosyltransferase
MNPQLSIIIPAFNEEERIGRTLDRIFSFLDESGLSAEVIVIDDGSSDTTSAVAEARIAEKGNSGSRVIRYDANRGKGYAVRLGMKSSAAPILLFTDADLSTPIEEISKLTEPILSGECDVAFGSRAIDRSLIGERQSWRREQGGRIFNLIVRIFTGLDASDTQCGFKAFKMERFGPLIPTLEIDRFGFDVEMLAAARQAGLRLKEIPVRWDNDDRSKVSFLKDSFRMFKEVLIIRKRIRKGAYKLEATS